MPATLPAIAVHGLLPSHLIVLAEEVWRSGGLEEVGGSGGGLGGSEAVSTKLWRWQEALEAVDGCTGGRRFGGSKHEALEAAGVAGGSRRLWRRSKARRKQA